MRVLQAGEGFKFFLYVISCKNYLRFHSPNKRKFSWLFDANYLLQKQNFIALFKFHSSSWRLKSTPSTGSCGLWAFISEWPLSNLVSRASCIFCDIKLKFPNPSPGFSEVDFLWQRKYWTKKKDIKHSKIIYFMVS